MNWNALWRDDLRTRPARVLSMSRLGEGLLEIDAPPIKVLFVYASNPVASIPHQTKVVRGLLRDDLFTVVAEHFLTDTTRYADIVLPATMQIEHRDLLIAYGHMYMAWNEPAVPPPANACPRARCFAASDPQAEPAGASAYPLALLTPADHYFLNSIFANVPLQQQRSGVPALLIHPDDASPRRIATRDEVRIANTRGSFVAVAEVTDRVRLGVVASTKGRWPAHARQGATVNATVGERDSDMGGGAVYHDNRVRVDLVT